jgi:hypothetical protein
VAAEAEAVKPQPLPDGAGDGEIYPLGVVASRRGLQRILLEATRLDLVVSLASQVAEVPSTRDRLRKELDLELHPLLLMRIGRAAPTPASKRRALTTIISETGD